MEKTKNTIDFEKDIKELTKDDPEFWNKVSKKRVKDLSPYELLRLLKYVSDLIGLSKRIANEVNDELK